MEAPLVRELLEMKEEITRQMDITEKLTSQVKGNRKSYLEVENANLIKERSLREQQKHNEHDLRIDDSKDENELSLDGDSDVVNEVTITSDETPKEDSDGYQDFDDDDCKRQKNNQHSKTKLSTQKKNDEGIYFLILQQLQ